MNLSPLRATLVKELAIFVGIFIVLGAITFYLSSLNDDLQQQQNKTTALADRILTEKREIDARFTTVRDSIKLYEESEQRIKTSGLFIDPRAVRDLFNVYQTSLALHKLSVDLQPITDLSSDPKYARKHFYASKTSGKISVEALSDEDIYALVQSMQRELPGFIKITSFSINKKQELSETVLTQIRKDGTFPLITAEMTFDWYGIKSTDAASTMNQYVAKVRPEGKKP